MATFDEIRKANEQMQTTDIKGRPYMEVNQRIKAFRMVYPEGFIITEMLSNDGGICVFKASVGYRSAGEPVTLGTGTAYEKESSSFINKTSYIENCETSAVGRALGMAGFGIDTSVASYEEVANAIQNQNAPARTSTPTTQARLAMPRQVQMIRENCDDAYIARLLKKAKVDRLEDLTEDQAGAVCLRINDKKVQNGTAFVQEAG